SNVMAYIARSNLALSVTVTAITTMIAPIMTPLWMKLLAGTLVEVSFVKMMIEIIKIVLVPIGAALIHDYLKHALPRERKIAYATAAVAVVWMGILIFGGWKFFQSHFTDGELTAIALAGFLLSAFPIGVVYHELAKRFAWLDRFMPTMAIV